MRVPYYTKGKSPTLLIHAGTHGDEYGVVESVRKAVKKYKAQLPDFIYVPVVSPSAIEKRTRNNGDGVDLNRSFFENSTVDEVEANLAIVRGKKFDLLVTFHEDVGRAKPEFYLYDIGCNLGGSKAWSAFKNEVRKMGVDLLDGRDDPDDPTLNYVFKEGYRYWPLPIGGYGTGTFDAWAINNGVVGRVLIPEVPNNLAQELKDRIVERFFVYFLI